MKASRKILFAGLAFAPLLAIGSASTAGAATPQAITPVGGSVTSSTHVTAHPDSSNQGGNWANDNFTRTATVTRRTGTVPGSNCGSATICYKWTGVIKDSGTFTSIAGALAPRTGTEDQSLTGSFSGGSATIQFYASTATAFPHTVPATVTGDVSGRQTTTDWVEQFFSQSTTFGSANNPGDVDLGQWGWTYTLNFGKNAACPNDAYQWVDNFTTGGGANTDGNVLTPNAADCS